MAGSSRKGPPPPFPQQGDLCNVTVVLFPFVGFSLLAGFIDEHYLVPYAYLQVFVCDWAAKVLCKCCKIAHFLG